MNKLSIFLWGSFFLFFSTPSSGQQTATDLNAAISTCQRQLIAAGLENIEIQVAPQQTIWIAYENRRYRNEVTALGIVLQAAAVCFESSQKFIIVPQYRRVAIKFIGITCERFQQFIRNQITPAEFIAHLDISVQPAAACPWPGYGSSDVNSSFFKFDLAMSPGWKAQLAQPHDPAQLQFNILTSFSVTPTTGMQVRGQFVAPFYNEFPRWQGRSHLEQIQVNQLVRLPYRAFLSLSAGRFEFGCYGVSSQIKQFWWQDRLSLTGRWDWLQTGALNRWLPIAGPVPNHYCYLLQAEYRFEPIDFRARLTWGRYLLGDQGWRIDVLRKFHELELGFMGVWSQSLQFLTGMTVRIPFPLSRQPFPSRVRFTTPRFLPWTYRYLPCYDGYILDNGSGFEEIADQLTPSFIRANSSRLKDAQRYVKLNEPDSNKKLLAARGQR